MFVNKIRYLNRAYLGRDDSSDAYRVHLTLMHAAVHQIYQVVGFVKPPGSQGNPLHVVQQQRAIVAKMTICTMIFTDRCKKNPIITNLFSRFCYKYYPRLFNSDQTSL
jgi:hypothetical protein